MKPGDKDVDTLTSSRMIGDVALCSGDYTFTPAAGQTDPKGFWTKVVGKVGNDWNPRADLQRRAAQVAGRVSLPGNREQRRTAVRGRPERANVAARWGIFRGAAARGARGMVHCRPVAAVVRNTSQCPSITEGKWRRL
jgi:hypothetical protein